MQERKKLSMMDEILQTPGDGDIPSILCKRNGIIPETYNLKDSSWEGLKKGRRGGKVSFVPDENFILYIQMGTGLCRIHDTEFNRKRLDILSKPHKKKVTKHEMQADGKIKEVDVFEPVQGMYERVEQDLIKQNVEDAMYERIKKEIAKDFIRKDEIDKPKEERKPNRVMGKDDTELKGLMAEMKK